MASPFYGVDLGSLSTFLVAESGDIIRNELGGHSSESLVGFAGKERAIGAAAAAQASTNPKNTVGQLHLLLGTGATTTVQYKDEAVEFAPEALVAMLLAKLKGLAAAKAAEGDAAATAATAAGRFAFAVPGWYGPKHRRALLDAAVIAQQGGAWTEPAVAVPAADCLCAVFARKHPVAAGEPARTHCFVDHGNTHLTLTVARFYNSSSSSSSSGAAGGGDGASASSPSSSSSSSSASSTSYDILVSQSFDQTSAEPKTSLGVAGMDECLFEILAAKARAALGGGVDLPLAAGSKARARLVRGVERMRKLLSTMGEAEVTVENLAEDRDVKLSVSRGEFYEALGAFGASFRGVFSETLSKAKASHAAKAKAEAEAEAKVKEGETPDAAAAAVEEEKSPAPLTFASVELLGGGTRIPFVQDMVTEVCAITGCAFDPPFGQKLDTAALAHGAALVAAARAAKKAAKADGIAAALAAVAKAAAPADGEGGAAPPLAPEALAATLAAAKVEEEESGDGGDDDDVEGMSAADIAAAAEAEAAMAAADAECSQIAEAFNAIESFILEMRGAPHDSKYGASIDGAALGTALDAAEEWMYSEEAAAAGVAEMQGKLESLNGEVRALCSEYFAAKEKERAEKEAAMEAAAAAAAAERAANGEDMDDDRAEKDTRKLSKPDRMRRVMKHKETGTEMFKNKNWMHAAKHYKDALTHCSHFYDLSPEDEAEVKAVKLTLYLNLATTWTKIDNMDQVLKCANDALALDGTSAKALFRRAMVLEKRKKFDEAKKDLELALQQPGAAEDKAIATLMKRVDIQIKREKDKEKKMASKMFG